MPALRDPLSVNPVVLPNANVPGIVSQGMEALYRADALKRQQDAQKMQLLTKMQDVEAIGWENDQVRLDKMKSDYLDEVTNIMRSSDGQPTSEQLRKISGMQTQLKQLTQYSVAQKKNYESDRKLIQDTFIKDPDKIKAEAAIEELDKHYQKPIESRGLFDVTPFINDKIIDPLDAFKDIKLGAEWEITNKGTGSAKQVPKEAGFKQAVIESIIPGTEKDRAFTQWVKSGKGSTPHEFAQYLYDVQLAQRDLGYKAGRTPKDSPEPPKLDTFLVPSETGGYVKAQGYGVKGGSTINIPDSKNPGKTIKFNPDYVISKDGVNYAVGTVSIPGQKEYISSEQYIALRNSKDPAEQAEAARYVPELSGGWSKQTTGTTYVTRWVPFDEVETQLETNKWIQPKVDESLNKIKSVQQDSILNQFNTTGTAPAAKQVKKTNIGSRFYE
jgi:hypothetical protein